jgi:hypothetical protein
MPIIQRSWMMPTKGFLSVADHLLGWSFWMQIRGESLSRLPTVGDTDDVFCDTVGIASVGPMLRTATDLRHRWQGSGGDFSRAGRGPL